MFPRQNSEAPETVKSVFCIAGIANQIHNDLTTTVVTFTERGCMK